MNDAELKKQLERLTARLDRIEKRLGIEPIEAPAQVTPDPPPIPPTAPAQHVTPPTARPARVQSAAPPTTPHVVPAPRRRPTAPPSKPRTPLEIRIGQNWMAWVGAIVTVVGAGFLVKLGYDAWWGGMTPAIRCLAVAGFGVLLVAVGELALRRIGGAASVGLLGAGLGTLYLDAFAAFKWFDPPVVPREWSFVLMGIVALLGFGITLRTGFIAIGVLSIVGGYLTPWLLGGGGAHTIEVGVFLTMLLGVALALSMARPRKFRPLRYVALAGTVVVGLGWMDAAPGSSWVATLVLPTIWWMMILVEAVVAALRRQSLNGNVVVTGLATASFVTLGCWVLHQSQPSGFDWLGAFTVAAGGVAAAVALHFGPPVSSFAGRPQSAMDRLAMALWAQAGVLLAVAVALQFDGFGQSIGWLAIGLASVEIGRRVRLRAVDVFGLVVGALAVARVALIDSSAGTLNATLVTVGDVTVTAWSVLAAVTILATHVAARRLGSRWRAGPIVLAALGTLGWVALCERQSLGLATTAGWLLASTVLIGLQRFGRRQGYLELGMVVLAGTAAGWLFDAGVARIDNAADITGHLPVLNWQMAMVAAITGVGWWSSRVLARRHRPAAAEGLESGSHSRQLALIAAAVLLLVGFSFEVDRSVVILQGSGRAIALSFGLLRQLFFTMLWAAGSVAIGFIARAVTGRGSGPRGGSALLVRFAWALLTVCAVKWLLGDTLYWTVLRSAGLACGAWPVVNLQLMTGLVVAGSAIALHRLTSARQEQPGAGPGAWVAPGAVLLLLWGLSFEVDRAVGQYLASRPGGWVSVWDPAHLRALWWTLLWAVGGLGMILWTRIRFSRPMQDTGWCVLAVAAVVWLGYDTVGWRLTEGVTTARVVLNVQFLVGAMTAAMLAVAVGLLRGSPAAIPVAVRYSLALIGLIGLWLGSLEIDRFFAPEAGRLAQNAAMVRQTGLSMYWGVFAIGLVLLGFAKRSAACRYGGLALLVITVGKVLTLDMAEVRYVWRVVSFLGVGLLLVATSVGYAKFSSRLVGESDGPPDSR